MARRALELDGDLAEAHAALGWVEMSDWDWWSAEEHFRRAIDLNPNSVVARVLYAEYLGAMGRGREAVRQAAHAIRVDPMGPGSVAHAAEVFMAAGQVDDAVTICRRALRRHPDAWFAHGALGEAYVLRGMPAQAIPELQAAVAACRSGAADSLGLLARAYAGTGRRERARQVLDQLEKLTKPARMSGPGPALAYLALGDREHALVWLEQAYDSHDDLMMTLNRREFDPLRSDPRFQNLMQRIGLRSMGADAGTDVRAK